ncbi:MAG: hypothetical protein QXG01_01390 [Candidatus Bathyarchaeia archaeon]
MSELKLNFKTVCVMALILIALLSTAKSASAAYNGKLIPPSPYAVYTNQVYTLSVGFQYMAATPCAFWIESPPFKSSAVTLKGSGTSVLSLTLKAPPTPGTYMLGIKLYGQVIPDGTPQPPILMDAITVTYTVIEPVKTDWDVENVWIEPKSPGVDDQVKFLATIVLRSTTSTKPLIVQVACYLDKKLYYSGSLTFSPKPSKQDIAVPKLWKATEGSHVLVFIVDPGRQHNDPTPYPSYNFKEHRFTVEPYYAIVKSINTIPSEVEEGEGFKVEIIVEYRLPGSANLRVRHYNNATQPPVSDENLDTVSGSGTKSYIFAARAPLVCHPEPTWQLQGTGSVMFDRGAGWQKTEPGWWKFYEITVRSPRFYAILDSTSAEHLGGGRIAITLQVRHFLPSETGLRIIVRTNATEIWRDESTFTQEGSVERTVTYRCEWVSSSPGNIGLGVSVEYRACGAWRHGDDGFVQVNVPGGPRSRLPVSFSDYIMAAFQRIIDWIKGLFGIR